MLDYSGFNRSLANAITFIEDLREEGCLKQGGEDYPNAWGAIECSHALDLSLKLLPSGTLSDPFVDAVQHLIGVLEEICDNDYIPAQEQDGFSVSEQDLIFTINQTYQVMPTLWNPTSVGQKH